MAHDVQFSIPPRDLGRADISFRVKRNGSVLGTLDISKGSVVWFPKDASYGHKVGWGDLDALMREHGARAEKR
jgi:hypothetical protein